MTDVSVLVPYRPGCEWRESSWRWVQRRYQTEHPGWEVVLGASPDGPFNRAAAILDAAVRSVGEVLVVADADVWCDPHSAIQQVCAGATGWAVPHSLVHRLNPDSTLRVIAGADWRGLPLSNDNRQDRRPYRGHVTGTLVVVHRDVLERVPPDPRFIGWGHEDDAWAIALRTLEGREWRGTDDLVHLWHPAQPRKARHIGNDVSVALFRRYRDASGDTAAMRSLIDEWRAP